MFEVFTLGDTPFPTITPEAVLRLLEKGERLPQPNLADDEM